MPGSQTLLALTVSCAFGFGLIVMLLSSMRRHLAEHLKTDEEHVDGLWAAMNFVFVPLTFAAGLLVDVAGVRTVVLCGGLFLCIALLILAWASSASTALPAYLLTAVAGAFMACAGMVLMPRAFFGPQEAAASLNMGNVFFALGALVAPALADVLLRSLGLSRSLVLFAFAGLIPCVLVLFVPVDALPEAEGADPLGQAVRPFILMASLVFFLYAPIEGCLHTWASTFLRNLGTPERNVGHLIAGFWSCFLLGRLLTAYTFHNLHNRLLPEGSEPWVLFVLVLGATVMLGNLMGAVRRRSAATVLLLLGLFLGPIFPTLIGYVFSVVKVEYGTAFGVVFVLGSAGSLFVAPLMSARVNHTSAQAALRIPFAVSVLLLAVSLCFAVASDLW